MDNPIISPWIFYMANLCDDISRLLCILAAITFILMLVLLGKSCEYSEDKKNAIRFGGKEELAEIEQKQVKQPKRIKLAITFFVVFLTINAFIPSSNTIYQMMAANLATPNNIEYMKNDAVQFVQDMTKAIINAKYPESERDDNVHS